MWRRKKNAVKQLAERETQNQVPVEPQPDVGESMVPTRRSLRQQARQATRTVYTNGSSTSEDEDSGSEDADSGSELVAPDPAPQRNKRFLKVSQPQQRKRIENETTAAVLNRLIVNRGMKNKRDRGGSGLFRGRGRVGNAAVAGGSRLMTSSKAQRGRGRGGASVDSHAFADQDEEQMSALPLKVEITEGHNQTLQFPSAPSKRGRKRRVDVAWKTEAGHQSQPLNLTTSTSSQGQQQQHRKRGRQSAATETVKPRFPFCSICLSKAPPEDYIINYMSCPNEYQRMKRLFAYVYKDLKFPFVPFDLERENVFDYCDLPLCDCCIQLYREIYDCYSQIETARDQLKAKIERMVYQIQLSEKNPAVAYQLNTVKNSPDSLMNKYCNFRKRFGAYRPGENRSQVEGSCLVPASIARIQIVNTAPKRTTGAQTFLTAGDFPATTPKLPDPSQPAPAPQKNSLNIKTDASTPSTSTATAATNVSAVKPIIKVEPGLQTTTNSAPAKTSTKDDSSKTTSQTKTTVAAATASNKPKPTEGPSPKPANSLPVGQTVQKPKPNPPAPPTTINRAPSGSVVTIIKTPGGQGPAIIRKIPYRPPLNNSASRPSNGPQSSPSPTAGNTPGPSSSSNQKFTKTFILVPKDEPCDADSAEPEEADPFLSGEHVNSQPSEPSEPDTTTTTS